MEDLIQRFGPPFLMLLITLVVLGAAYLHHVYNYWKVRGVPGPAPIWFLGNMYPRIRATLSMAEYDRMLYEKHGGKKYCGIFEYLRPALVVGDLELLKRIMIKDFDHFTDRSMVTFNEPVMDKMLLGLKGSVWKAVRSVMTPTFSSGKIKQTLSLVKDCSVNLKKFFTTEIEKGHCIFEMKEVYGKFTMDTIASIAFGVSSDSLNDAQDEFSAAAARFFTPKSKQKKPIVFLQFVLSKIAKFFGIHVFDRTPIQFFTKVVSDTIKYRLENNVRRNDFLQLLLDASIQEQTNNNKTNSNDKRKTGDTILTELIITSQCVLFYIAGYDTTATTLSFVSFCLALNPDIQQTLLEEIDDVLEKFDGEINYESIQEMTYLDMVFTETLRLYPPAPRVDRRCTKDFIVPNSDFIIAKDTKIIIPIYSIHRDSDLYPEPEKFDPERFSAQNKQRRPQNAYMPFGSGPRNCIGGRFALMEAKIAMVYILQDFAFIPSKKTKVPITIEKKSGLLKSVNGVWVRLAKRVCDYQ